MHKGHEREEREKQRAKAEVDRLNGVVKDSSAGNVGNPWDRRPAIPQSSASRQATPAERKQQLQKLAEMGVAVPDDFRKEMAMAGDWQVTSQRIICDISKEEADEDVKSERLAVGVRKRKFDGQEEEEEADETVVRKGWGSTTRSYPGITDDEHDLNALLSNTKALRRSDLQLEEGKHSDPAPRKDHIPAATEKGDAHDQGLVVPPIKNEDGLESAEDMGNIPAQETREAASFKSEEREQGLNVVFKKRKAKPIRCKE